LPSRRRRHAERDPAGSRGDAWSAVVSLRAISGVRW
jgi:hypothetical protein